MRLVVGQAVADGIGDGHVARPGGVEQAGAAEHRVGPELQRVEVVVVDPAVDARRPGARPSVVRMYSTLSQAHQVPALDQLHAHLAGQERVLEVGRVVHPRRQQDDHRVVRRSAAPTPAAPPAAWRGSRRRAGPGGSRTARGTRGSWPGGSRSRRRSPRGCGRCPPGRRSCPPGRAPGRCPRRGPGPRWRGSIPAASRWKWVALVTRRRLISAVVEHLAGAVDVVRGTPPAP